MDEGKDRKNEKALVRVASIATLVYVSFSAWRLASLEQYQTALEASFQEKGSNPLSELYATSTGLMYGNYTLLLVFSVAILLCAWRGTAKRDKILIKWHQLGNVACIVVTSFTIVNLIITGSLCTTEKSKSGKCGSLTTSFVFSLLVAGLVVLLYCVSFWYGGKLLRSKTFDFESKPTEQVQLSPSYVQPQPKNTAQSFDEIPFATPV